MQLLLRITAITYLLMVLTVQYTSPDSKFIKQQNQKVTDLVEKNTENQYITLDSNLTKQMNMNQVIMEIKTDLKLKRIPKYHLLQTYQKAVYPSLVDQNKIKETYSPTYEINGKTFVDIDLPIQRGITVTHYVYRIPNEIQTHIEIKQQSRMYTVTHLQNDKWKTVPTRYQSRKKLSLGIEQNLPDLNPNLETKGISHYIQNEVVIKFRKSLSQGELQLFLNEYKLQLKNKHDHTIIAYCPKRSTKKLITTIEKDNRIEYIEPHFIYLTNEVTKKPTSNQHSFIPNDRLYLDYQWNLPTIYTSEAWAFSKGKSNVVVAVIDTGVDLNHPEFQGKLVKGYNIVNPNKPPLDDDGHGTHVTGIIAANTNNGQGIAGITWYNKIMPVKVLDQSGAGTLFDVAQGIIWATDHGANIINLSLGNYAESKYLHDAIQYAYSKNVVLIAATGNDNTSQLGYPASYPEVIGVSAIDPNQQRAEFSNYGDDVDVVAPGVNIASTYPNNQYAALSGTSMASPHVAALAALIKSNDPDLSNKDIMKIITETATDLGSNGRDAYFGNGEINIEKAVELSNQMKQKQKKAYTEKPQMKLPKKENILQRLFDLFR